VARATIPSYDVRRPSEGVVGALVLLGTTVIWGVSFVVAKKLVDHHDPLSVLAWRFVIGTVAVWCARPRAVLSLPAPSRRRAAVIGVLLGVAQVPHYFGVRESTASTAAFLIGTYVVMTPVVDRLLFGARATRATVLGAAMAFVGLAVFAAGGTVSFAGLVLCLVAALLYAVEISSVGAWVPRGDLWGFTTVTMAVSTVVVLVPAAVVGLEVPSSTGDWTRLVYLALVAGVAGVALQAWAQRRLPAAQAAVILVAEPIWAALVAVLFTAETLPPQLVVGGAILLAANLLVVRASRTGPVQPGTPDEPPLGPSGRS
jgi:drug/metabolite transporter (DMT)-like permease